MSSATVKKTNLSDRDKQDGLRKINNALRRIRRWRKRDNDPRWDAVLWAMLSLKAKLAEQWAGSKATED
jgi:hypothetical protein